MDGAFFTAQVFQSPQALGFELIPRPGARFTVSDTTARRITRIAGRLGRAA